MGKHFLSRQCMQGWQIRTYETVSQILFIWIQGEMIEKPHTKEYYIARIISAEFIDNEIYERPCSKTFLVYLQTLINDVPHIMVFSRIFLPLDS